MHLLFVVLHRGKNKLEATVKDSLGNIRRVVVQWFVKGYTDVPPEVWVDVVAKEVEFQIAAEAEKKAGRILF